PRFDSTGNVLYFHRRAAIIQNGAYVGNEDSLERLDLRTGERKRILTDGADPTISPAGDRIVYVHLSQGYPDAIWTANIDGSNPHPYFRTKDTWWYLQTPRFAAKGCEIVFSAAGHALAAAVPHTANGLDEHRLVGCRLDLVAKPTDIHLQVLRLVAILRPPDAREQGVVRERLARVARELREEVELRRCEVDVLPSAPDAAR